jgi:hypothetical protein
MGSGFVIASKRIRVPGLEVTSWLDDPSLALRYAEDYCHRSPAAWIRAIVIHTTKGLPGCASDPPQVLLDGLGPSVDAGHRVARYWSTDKRQAGAHLIIDHDGAVFQTVDLRTGCAYHCPGFNTGGIGVELYQSQRGELYKGQLEVAVRVIDFLTAAFHIQRMVPHRYVKAVQRMVDGGANVTGVIGHRDAARNRGPGDPGSHIFYYLGSAGYEDVDYDLDKDRELWRPRQRELGVIPADGIAGLDTAKALMAAGRPHGLWVERPGDRDAVA